MYINLMGLIDLDSLYYYSSATDPYDHSPPNNGKSLNPKKQNSIVTHQV